MCAENEFDRAMEPGCCASVPRRGNCGTTGPLVSPKDSTPGTGSRVPAEFRVCAGDTFLYIWRVVLGGTTQRVDWVKQANGPMQVGDEIVSVAGVTNLRDWTDVAKAFACVPAPCAGAARGTPAAACAPANRRRTLCVGSPQCPVAPLP